MKNKQEVATPVFTIQGLISRNDVLITHDLIPFHPKHENFKISLYQR